MISQTKEAVTLDEYSFPAAFLLQKGFPELPDGAQSRFYDLDQNLFSISDGKSAKSAGPIPWEKGDDFLARSQSLFEELKEEQGKVITPQESDNSN